MFLLIASARGARSASTRLAARACVSMPVPAPSLLMIFPVAEPVEVVPEAVEDADVFVPDVGVFDEDVVVDETVVTIRLL